MEDNKYQQGKIYKIVCNITGEVYIGSTTDTLSSRLSKHKYDINNKKTPSMSKHILNRGDYKIELIKDYPCNNRRELEEEEQKNINKSNCINKNKSYQSKKEREEYVKEWKEDNKDKINKKKRETYNKDKRQDYWIKNKDKMLEKIKCECGALVSSCNLTRHKKSMKHIKLTECIIID